MIATCIVDIYQQDDANGVARALEDIASAADGYGFASAGVYVFWNASTAEVLYVGLAVDLGQRFKQHNGLLDCPEPGCKVQRIREYFSVHEMLGFSAFVQSPLSQPASSKFALQYGLDRDEIIAEYGDLVRHGHLAIVQLEGRLIRAHQLKHGALPPWNRMGGSRLGAQGATLDHNLLLEIATGRRDDEMAARTSIRALAADPTVVDFESFLHGVRLRQALSGRSFEAAWQATPDFAGVKRRMLEMRYLTRSAFAKPACKRGGA